MTRRAPNVSADERAARSKRMRANLADPAFREKQRAGGFGWTDDRRAETAERMRRLMLDPAYQARLRATAKHIAVPQHTHPVIRGLYVEMNEQQAMLRDVTRRCGFGCDLLTKWRKRTMPRVDTYDAALNALGLELAIVPAGTRDQNGFIRKKPRKATTGELPCD